MNGRSWDTRGRKRPFFKRIAGFATAGIRGNQGTGWRENGLPNLTKFYGAGKGDIGTVLLLWGSLKRDFLFFGWMAYRL